MRPGRAEEAARILLAARRDGRKIDGLPAACRPRDLDEAYEVQDALLALMEEPASGWFLACTAPAMQKAHGLPTGFFGRMLRTAVFASPARVPVPAGVRQSLEVELVFRLGRDLVPRDEPYAEVEVAEAVAAMHPGIEIVEGRYTEMLAVDGPTLVADNGTDGLLVLGSALADWRALDRPGLAVSLAIDGRPAAEGSGRNVMGDPLAALAWFANEARRRGLALRAGETVNTGNCLDRYVFGLAGQRIEIDCGPLGRAEAVLVADGRREG